MCSKRNKKTTTKHIIVSIIIMGIKNTEREELHKTIWSIAEELRGAVDGWEFKAYV